MAQNPRKVIWTRPLKMILLLALAIDLSIQANICAECDDKTELEKVNSNEFLTDRGNARITLLDETLLDPNKIVTCEGRCGEDSAMPCSCHAKCFVYNNCCENIAVDCPYIEAEGYEMYGDLMDAQTGCNDYGVFVISSCVKKNDIILKKRDIRMSNDPQLGSNSESKEVSHAESKNNKRSEYAEDFTNIIGSKSDLSDAVGMGDNERQIKPRFKRYLDEIQNELQWKSSSMSKKESQTEAKNKRRSDYAESLTIKNGLKSDFFDEIEVADEDGVIYSRFKRDVAKRANELLWERNALSQEESQERSKKKKRPDYEEDLTNRNGLKADFSDAVEEGDAEEPTNSRLARIKDALYNAPAYDSSTGFLYVNSQVFFCNGGNESNLVLWDVQFEMSSTDGITTFEEIEQRLLPRQISYRPPAYQNYSQAGDRCYNDAQSNCDGDDYQLYEDCLSFISYVYADKMVYNNRFCFQCERGNDVFFPVYTAKSSGHLVQHDFSALMSISKSNSLRVVLVDSVLGKEQWADVRNCSIGSNEQEEQNNCHVQICDRYFVPRSDGTCNVLHNAMIAFSADDYPLTDMEKDQAPKFLSCGLEKYLGVKVEDTNSLMLVQHDKNLNETMYVAKMSIYLPSLNQITTSDETRMSENMRKFFRFLKTFRELRKPWSAAVCEFVMDRKDLLDHNGTSLADSSSYEAITFHKASKTNYNSTLKGKEISDDVTTFCMATSPAKLKLANELFCLQEPLYQTELEKILEMCKSPCFSDFVGKYSKSGGNIESLTSLMTFSLFALAMVTV